MTDKQYKLMDVIAVNFINKEFYFSELKQYGEFYPATLTSLVNLGYVQKKEDSKGKALYRYIEPDLNPEELAKNKQIMELNFQINQAKGVLQHLENSKQSWIKQLEAMGLDFPEEKYEEWSGLVLEQTQKYLFSKEDELFTLSQTESAF